MYAYENTSLDVNELQQLGHTSASRVHEKKPAHLVRMLIMILGLPLAQSAVQQRPQSTIP